MDDDWIALGEAISTIRQSEVIAKSEAVPFLMAQAKDAEVGSRVALIVDRSEGQPTRNVPMNEAHWHELEDLETDWIDTGNVEFTDGYAWRGIQIHGGDLASALRTRRGGVCQKLQPVAPPPPTVASATGEPRLPPEQSFVSLSEALTWVAFGVSMDSDQLCEVLNLDHYQEHDPQEAIKAAMARLAALGSGGEIAMRGKYRPSYRDDRRTLLTAPIPPEKLDDYRLFNELYDALEHGEGMFHWRTPQGMLSRNGHGGRSDSFVGVKVNRADLMREFPPKELVQSKPRQFRGVGTFKRGGRADVAPWWSVNEALAWIATRQADFVYWVGSRERRESGIGALITHFIFEQDVASVQPVSLVEDAWPGASALAQAGRLLLGQIQSGQVMARLRGSVVTLEAFVGIGLDETGADWLDLDPPPLFSPDEVMEAFPADGTTLPKLLQPVSRKGRAKGTGYGKADAPLLEKMAQAIADDPSLNATSAAKLFADEAKGASFEAKADRLARAFRAGKKGE